MTIPLEEQDFGLYRLSKGADIDWIIANKEQLFGEAVERYLRGEPYWIMPEEVTKIKQQEVQRADEWTEIIQNFLASKPPYTSTLEIAFKVLEIPLKELDKSKQMRIADILKQLGWKRKLVRVKGKARRIWIKGDSIDISEFEEEEVY